MFAFESLFAQPTLEWVEFYGNFLRQQYKTFPAKHFALRWVLILQILGKNWGERIVQIESYAKCSKIVRFPSS